MKHHSVVVYDAVELGNQIRALRQEHDLPQAELAERIGVGRMTVSRLEQGGAVSIDTALRALSECGFAIAVVPKFTKVVVKNG